MLKTKSNPKIFLKKSLITWHKMHTQNFQLQNRIRSEINYYLHYLPATVRYISNLQLTRIENQWSSLE